MARWRGSITHHDLLELPTGCSIRGEDSDAQAVWLFGSAVEDVSARDVDLAVEGLPPERFFDSEPACTFELPKPGIDLVDLSQNPPIAAIILPRESASMNAEADSMRSSGRRPPAFASMQSDQPGGEPRAGCPRHEDYSRFTVKQSGRGPLRSIARRRWASRPDTHAGGMPVY